MTVTITAWDRSPDGGKGLARDTRVRWALEETGQPYAVHQVSHQEMKQPGHLARNPFGQIPTYEEGDLVLFRNRVHRAAHRRAPRRPVAARARCAGRARSPGCSPRSTRSSRRSWS
jgi:glutathione S-transferase